MQCRHDAGIRPQVTAERHHYRGGTQEKAEHARYGIQSAKPRKHQAVPNTNGDQNHDNDQRGTKNRVLRVITTCGVTFSAMLAPSRAMLNRCSDTGIPGMPGRSKPQSRLTTSGPMSHAAGICTRWKIQPPLTVVSGAANKNRPASMRRRSSWVFHGIE